MTLAMNATVPCPSESHRRVALAHGRICGPCEAVVEWAARCPICGLDVAARGDLVLPHVVDSRWPYVQTVDCPGGGAQVLQPVIGNQLRRAA